MEWLYYMTYYTDKSNGFFFFFIYLQIVVYPNCQIFQPDTCAYKLSLTKEDFSFVIVWQIGYMARFISFKYNSRKCVKWSRAPFFFFKIQIIFLASWVSLWVSVK